MAQDDGDGHVWVHNNKQGFQDCEPYARLELWLGRKVDEYLDNNFDSLTLVKNYEFYDKYIFAPCLLLLVPVFVSYYLIR